MTYISPFGVAHVEISKAWYNPIGSKMIKQGTQSKRASDWLSKQPDAFKPDLVGGGKMVTPGDRKIKLGRKIARAEPYVYGGAAAGGAAAIGAGAYGVNRHSKKKVVK